MPEARRPVTAIVTTRDEAEVLEDCLESLAWCDELIVVDSGSSDGTLEIARRYTARVLERAYKSAADQKNWVIPQAAHEWVVLLDADERLTPALRTEIESVLSRDDISEDGFWIRRRNFFLGKRIRYSGWGRDKVVRLFRSTMRYPDKQVHAEIESGGALGMLREPMVHLAVRDIRPFVAKWERYTTWSAIDAQRKGVRPGLWHFLVKPGFRFTKQFLFQGGFLDGWRGFIICALDGSGVLMRYIKLWGMQHGPEKHG